MPTVYLETSVISYLTARPSRDIVVAAHQQTTRDWWDTRGSIFDLYISENAIMRGKIEKLCRAYGYEPSIICTPEELIEDER